MTRMLERKVLERGGTVTVEDERPTAQLEELVADAVKYNGHVVIALPIRVSQAARLNAIAGVRHLTLRKVSRVVVR